MQETIYKFGTNTENPIERVGKEYSVHHVYVQDPSNTEDYNVVGNDGGLLTITDKEINYRSCSVCHLKWGSKRIYTRYYSADNQEQATDETKVKEVTETEEIDSYSSGETNKHTYSSTRNYSGGKLASEEFTRTEEYTRGTKVLNSSESSGSVVYDSYLRKDNQVGRFLSQYCSDANWANYLGNQMYEAYLGEYTYQNTQYYEDGSYEESYATVEYTIKDSECVYDLNMSRQSTYYDEEGEPYERTPVNVFFEDITNHAEPERVSVSEATCTQYETYTINCNKCGDEGTEVLWDWNLGHDYRYDDVSGRMVCTKCGLENDKSVDGPIVLEDLSQNQKYAQQGYIVIGYNYNVRDWRFEEIYNGLFHNHFHPFGFMVAVTLIGEDGDTQFILDGVDPIVSDMYDTESLIKISLSEIAAAGEQYQGQLGSNFSIMISLVFNDASGLACNITLDPTEFSING